MTEFVDGAVEMPHKFTCPTCGTGVITEKTLCLPCTEAEIGETLPELRARVTDKIAKSASKKWRVQA